MKLAYADPPYLGCGKLYPEHPDALYWDDPEAHGNLMAALELRYDGWAFSASSPSLSLILPYAPAGTRVAAWVKPFAAFKRNVRIAYTWEPVLFKPGRDSSKDGAPVGRDHLSQVITLRKGLTGAKPEAFNRWILTLLGYVEGDELDDLFPGTGGMAAVLRQTTLAAAYAGAGGEAAASAEEGLHVEFHDVYEEALDPLDDPNHEDFDPNPKEWKPAGLECPECGDLIANPGALVNHRKFRHGLAPPQPSLDVERLTRRLTEVIEDAESQHPGGWGPDVTTVVILREIRDDLAAAAPPPPRVRP